MHLREHQIDQIVETPHIRFGRLRCLALAWSRNDLASKVEPVPRLGARTLRSHQHLQEE